MTQAVLTQRPIAILQEGFRRGCLAGTYLFYGPQGSGKFQTALAFAKTWNCQEAGPAKTFGGCNRCLSCRKIEERIHPDVFIIQPEGGEIRIDRIRDIQRDMMYRPLSGEKKIYILQGADRMNIQTANAFLKALEEPPEDTHVLLLAERIHDLLPTLLSRCQKIPFHNPSSDRSSLGREAGTFGQPVIASGISSATSVAPRATDGDHPYRSVLQQIVTDGFQGISSLQSLAERLSKEEGAMESFLLAFSTLLRDLVLWKTVGDDSLLIDPSISPSEQAVSMDQNQLSALLNRIHIIQKGLDRNVNKRLALECLFLRLESYRKQVHGP